MNSWVSSFWILGNSDVWHMKHEVFSSPLWSFQELRLGIGRQLSVNENRKQYWKHTVVFCFASLALPEGGEQKILVKDCITDLQLEVFIFCYEFPFPLMSGFVFFEHISLPDLLQGNIHCNWHYTWNTFSSYSFPLMCSLPSTHININKSAQKFRF